MHSPRHFPVIVAVIGMLALALHGPGFAQTQGSEPMADQAAKTEQAFYTALQDYERCHWLLAFEQLVLLADQGHPEASRMAMQMRHYGPGLYGQTFTLLPGQAERFARARPLE